MARTSARQTFGAVVVVATLALATACGGGDSGGGGSSGADKPLKILYSSGITGLLAPSAKAVERGAQAAVSYINDNGGINGRKVEMTTVDNQSDPTRGVTLVQKALSGDDKPDLVIPGVSSNEALAVAPLLTRNKVIGLGPASSPAINDVQKYPYFFSESALQTYILQAVATKLSEEGAKSIALVAPNDALGDALGESIKAAFGKYNITTTDTRFADDAVDLSSAFAKAKQSKPDWIYMDSAGTQAAAMLAGRVKAGAETIPTVAGVVVGSQPLLDLAKGTDQMKDVNLMMLPTQSYVAPDKRSTEFKAMFTYLEKQGPMEVPASTYASGWNSVAVWAQAARAVQGDLTADKVKASLESLPAGGSPTEGDRLRFGKSYTAQSHFMAVEPDEFVLSPVYEVKDGMFTTTPTTP
jgi:branched-chain amino acid transport system substrate-binding protein